MNPVINPFAPGAGTPPPELAGRDDLRETVRVAIERVRRGLPTKSILMVGLRGVGKTVLLDRLRDDAEANGIHTVRIEAPEGRSLPALLAPQLRQALLRLSRNEKAKAMATTALRALAGFAKSLKFRYRDIEVGFDRSPNPAWPTTATSSTICRRCSKRSAVRLRPRQPRSSYSSTNSSMWRKTNSPR